MITGREGIIERKQKQDRKTLWSWLILASALAFLLICHLPTLPSPLFTVDDESLIKIPQLALPLNFKSIESIFRLNQHIDYYPIRDLSYALDTVLWGNALVPARVHQILLFWFSGVLMYWVLLELSVPWGIALLGTVAWVIHPYHIETIVWLSARKDVLAIGFGLLCLLLYLKAQKHQDLQNYQNHKNKKANTLCVYSLLAGSFTAFICGLLSKASVTPLPLLAVLTLSLRARSSRIPPATMIAVFLALIASSLSAFGQTWFYTHVNDMRNLIPWGLRIETSLTALGKMASGWFIPSINVVENDTFGEWTANNHPYLFVGILVWVTYFCLIAWALWKRKFLHLTGLITMGLFYFPVSGLGFEHRGFYSTRYFEPASLAIWIMLLINARIVYTRNFQPARPANKHPF